MPKKKSRKSRNQPAAQASGELAQATELFALADRLAPKLAARRDTVRAELERLESMLVRLGGVTGAPKLPKSSASAPSAPPSTKKAGRRRGKRSGPPLREIVLDALAKGALSSGKLYDAVVARRPGTGRNHLQTELFQLGRKGAVKRSGARGSYSYSVAG